MSGQRGNFVNNTYNQSSNATVVTTVPAALGAFSGTLLTDALTAITTLYARVDTVTSLVNGLIDDLQANGIAR